MSAVIEPGLAVGGGSLAGRRILFLGAAYHPLSVACLVSLSALGASISVAADDPLTESTRQTFSRLWRERGARAVAWRSWLVMRAQARLLLRRLGVPLRGVLSIQEACRAHRLPTMVCRDPNSEKFVQLIRDRGIELIVMANYRHILKRRLFDAIPFGAINVHPSLLPAYRGPDPMYWVLAEGAPVTGVTVHRVDAGVDTGPVLLQQSFTVAATDDERTLLDRSATLAAAMLREAVVLVMTGRARYVPQPLDGTSSHSARPRGASAL